MKLGILDPAVVEGGGTPSLHVRSSAVGQGEMGKADVFVIICRVLMLCSTVSEHLEPGKINLVEPDVTHGYIISAPDTYSGAQLFFISFDREPFNYLVSFYPFIDAVQSQSVMDRSGITENGLVLPGAFDGNTGRDF